MGALTKTEDRFHEMVAGLDAIVWELDVSTWRFTFVSRRAEQMLGYPVVQWLTEQNFWADHIYPEDRDRTVQACQAATAKGEDHRLEYRFVAADGRLAWLSNIVRVVKDKEGKPCQLRGVMVDITDRKQAEEALRESEDRYRDLVEHSHDLLCTHDLKGRLLSENPAPARLLGYAVEEMLQKSLREFLVPEFRDQFDEYLTRIQRDGVAKGFMAVQTRTGERRIWEYHNTLRTEGLASPIVRGMARDVTERKQAEDALRRSELRYRLLFDRNLAGVFAATGDGRFVDCNQALAQMLGYGSRQELCAYTLAEICFDAAEREDCIAQLTQRGALFNHEIRLRRKDGSPIWALSNSSMTLASDGTPELIQATVIDITEHKRAEERIRESERELRLLTEVIPQQIWSDLPDGSNDYCNQRLLQYHGRTMEELRGFGLVEMIHPDDRECVLKAWRQAVSQGTPYEVESRRRENNGEYRWFLTRGLPLRDAEGSIVRWDGTNTDIQDRKRAEEELRRSEAYLAEGQKLSHTGSWARKVPSGDSFWSQETFRIFGFDPVKAKPHLQLALQRVHPEDRPLYEQIVERENREGKHYEFQYRIVLPDGSIKYVYSVGHPVINESGDVAEVIGTLMDVTERKQAEESLRTSEARWRAIFENSAVGIAQADLEGKILATNHAYQQMIGYSDRRASGNVVPRPHSRRRPPA